MLLIELIIISILDIKTKKILNIWPILNITSFIILLFADPDRYHFIWQTFAYSGVFFVVGFVFFLLNIMGGGDSKFLFSFFLLVPLSLHETTFMLLLYSTFFMGSAFFLLNLIRHWQAIYITILTGEIKQVKNYFGTKFAYAPVILMSWVWLGIELSDQLFKVN
jgi:prepilin peptidase CpaA